MVVTKGEVHHFLMTILPPHHHTSSYNNYCTKKKRGSSGDYMHTAPLDLFSFINSSSGYGLNLEVERDEGEHQALQVLYEIIEDPEAFGVIALLDVQQRTNLGTRERDVLIANLHFQLLPSNSVWLWPIIIILPCDLAIFDYPFDFFNHSR
mmetsp:Transcript_22267/g.41317  ORF Transcript_22267/g.41317 Transcript_22267/m.41317 type:complete len:151 (-) Transcript_22267:223-675(-)